MVLVLTMDLPTRTVTNQNSLLSPLSSWCWKVISVRVHLARARAITVVSCL